VAVRVRKAQHVGPITVRLLTALSLFNALFPLVIAGFITSDLTRILTIASLMVWLVRCTVIGVKATDAGLVVVQPLWTRRIMWKDVKSISYDTIDWARRQPVVRIRTRSGRDCIPWVSLSESGRDQLIWIARSKHRKVEGVQMPSTLLGEWREQRAAITSGRVDRRSGRQAFLRVLAGRLVYAAPLVFVGLSRSPIATMVAVGLLVLAVAGTAARL
jgi:hypothetical protein